MKCPKCDYLGFETGDRCKNCGYDFSLIPKPDPQPIEIDLDLRSFGPELGAPSEWLARADGVRSQSAAAAQMSDSVSTRPEPAVVSAVPKRQGEPKLPLFAHAFDDESDEPLIKLPRTPRPPLAVRRTPDTPRLRTVPKAVSRIEPEPAFEFGEDGGGLTERQVKAETTPHPASGVWAEQDTSRAMRESRMEISGPGARLAAAAIDYLLLCAIDLAVVYFTLRIAGLPMSEWTALPPVPLLAFLLILQLAYFCAFTALGGQTIGKMAMRIRVVNADNGPIDAALALRRTLVGNVSAALLGLGFLPAFFDPDRRTLHDRVARTRVIALPSA